MAERFFAELVGLENATTFMEDLINNKGVVRTTVSMTPVSYQWLVATYYNDIPVVALDGSPTVSFEYGTTEPDWTTYVAVTDGDHASGYTLVVDSSAVDMDTVGTFNVLFTATDASGNVSDTLTVEITITDSSNPILVLDSGTANVTASEVATWTPATNITSATDEYDGDLIDTGVTYVYNQNTSGGTLIASLEDARTYLGTVGNVVYVSYTLTDSSDNTDTGGCAFTAVADE